jgi:hypothetical protein
LNLGYEYWEGAVQITGDRQGLPLKGYGYVEMTGYAGSFAGGFKNLFLLDHLYEEGI